MNINVISVVEFKKLWVLKRKMFTVYSLFAIIQSTFYSNGLLTIINMIERKH